MSLIILTSPSSGGELKHALPSSRTGADPARNSLSRLLRSEESEALSAMIRDCLSPSSSTPSHIRHRVRAFSLVNFSPFASDIFIDRVDRAVALVGDQWLSGLSLVDILAEALQRHLPISLAQEAFEIWSGSLGLAFAAELVGRSQQKSESIQAWCGSVLVGATEISLLSEQRIKADHTRIQELSSVLSAFQPCEFHDFGESVRANRGSNFGASEVLTCSPWPIVRMAQDLVSPIYELHWLDPYLSNTVACPWSHDVMRQYAGIAMESLQESVEDLALASWQIAKRRINR